MPCSIKKYEKLYMYILQTKLTFINPLCIIKKTNNIKNAILKIIQLCIY